MHKHAIALTGGGSNIEARDHIRAMKNDFSHFFALSYLRSTMKKDFSHLFDLKATQSLASHEILHNSQYHPFWGGRHLKVHMHASVWTDYTVDDND
eukprot:g56406.t1